MIIIAHDDDCALVLFGPTYDAVVSESPSIFEKASTVCSCGGHKYRLSLGDKYDIRRWTALVEEVTE